MNARIATFDPDFLPLTNVLHQTWQYQLANLVTDMDELCQLLALDKEQLSQIYELPPKFALRVPHAFVAKMNKGDVFDPLLRQILPTKSEQEPHAGFSLDPLAESDHNPIKGLLHKYQSRVLVTLTGVCAVNCRYCFRRHFDYQGNLPTSDDLQAICEYIRQDTDIVEVLLSGGDPLSVNNRRLGLWLSALSELPNIKTIRLHTRLPVVLPDRVDEELLALFANCPKHLVMVLHINHPQELDAALAIKCQQLKKAGVLLLNQSVLLKGINDNADTLAKLSYQLFDSGVLPYYLHALDKVAGAGHFLVDEKQAVAIYHELMAKVAGYLVPKFVQELPYERHKTPMNIYQT